MREGVIYYLVNPNALEIRYVGQTISKPSLRLRNHISEAKRSNRRVSTWIKSLLKKGLEPKLQIIEYCSQDILNDREIYHIKLQKELLTNLCNHCDGGKSGRNRTISIETRLKMSLMKKGKRNQ